MFIVAEKINVNLKNETTFNLVLILKTIIYFY